MKKINLFLIIFLSFHHLGFSQIKLFSDITPGEEVITYNKKVPLSGSLLKPDNGNLIHPVFIYLSGAGDFSFRSNYRPGIDFHPTKDVAEQLLEKGYAVLFMEKRGINKSGGNWRKSGFTTYAEDVHSMIKYLHTRVDIDTSNINLIGHSQGGYVGQIVAAKYPQYISSFINLVGPAESVHQQVLSDMQTRYECEGMEGKKLQRKLKGLKASLKLLSFISPVIKPVFLSHVINHDPDDYIPHIKCPVLTVYAENDYMVDEIKNNTLMSDILNRHHIKNHKIVILEDTTHDMIIGELCNPLSEENKRINPEFIRVLNIWLEEIKGERIIFQK
jgi:pimeloyl-ACP methyl ester carboxylesterase